MAEQALWVLDRKPTAHLRDLKQPPRFGGNEMQRLDSVYENMYRRMRSG
jgi:hypothetical protein